MGSWLSAWKNLTIAALAIAVIVLSGVLLKARYANEGKVEKGKADKRNCVGH